MEIANCNDLPFGEDKRTVRQAKLVFPQSDSMDTQMDSKEPNLEFPPISLPHPPGQGYP
jgi:hypothetical protein